MKPSTLLKKAPNIPRSQPTAYGLAWLNSTLI